MAKKSRTTPAPTENQRSKAREKACFENIHPLSAMTLRNGKLNLDHPDPATAQKLICEALGTSDWKFAEGLLKSVAKIARESDRSEEEFDFLIAAIKGIAPTDEAEAMLAVRMAEIHLTSARYARLLQSTNILAQMEILERGLNRLMRTSAIQMETLKRYRSKGVQKIVVQHVNVGEGGQAIVGDVHHQRSQDAANTTMGSPPLQLTHSKDRPMELIEELPTSPAKRKAKGTQ
jgi:hypothetical protein